jgi:hypothetical protein
MLATRTKALMHGFGPALLVAAVIAVRDPWPLLRAEFWAEDATEFFFDALGLGIRSLELPVYGHHFFLSRLIAYTASCLPVLYAPYIYAWAALIVNTVSVSYCVRDGFSWLLPERWQRILLAVVLAVGPGTADVLLNICTLPSSLALLALLLLLERPLGLGWIKLVALLLLIPSCGYAVLWLPLVAYLWWLTKDRAYVVVALAIVLMAAMNLWGSHHASAEAGLASYETALDVPRILAENSYTRLVLGPILGAKLTGMIMRAPAAVFWSTGALGLALLVVVVRWAYPKHREAIMTLALAYLGAIGSLAVVALNRTYAFLALVREGGTISWNLRYALLPGAVAIMVWMACLVRLDGPSKFWRAGRVLGLVVIAVHVASHWGSVHPRPDLHWPDKSVEVQAILDDGHRGQDRTITLRQLAVQPKNWLPANHRTAVVLPAM